MARLARRLTRLLPSWRDDLELIPSDSIASRALVTVIAIMTFLATLTGGAAMLVRDASLDWSATASREMTIQVKPAAGRNIEADARRVGEVVRGAPGVQDVRVFSLEESSRLLEPWLGAGLDLRELPVPVLVVLRLGDDRRPNIPDLRKEIASVAPTATLDDHRTWVGRLEAMAQAMVVVALVVLGLVLTAMGLAIAFATRGAMAGNREIVNVLHFVGATDSFIARQFQRHFLRLGFKGAGIGGLCAILTFLLSGLLLVRWSAEPSGEQVEALFGRFDLGASGYAVIAVIAVVMAVLTGLISRRVVYRQLRRMR
jgi:cell division transport system permease protein